MLRREQGKVHAIGQSPVPLSLVCVEQRMRFSKGGKVVKKEHCAHAAHRPSPFLLRLAWDATRHCCMCVKCESTQVTDEFLKLKTRYT